MTLISTGVCMIRLTWKTVQVRSGPSESYPGGKKMKEVVNDPIKVLILTFVTCGIYGIIWFFQVTGALSQELPEEDISAGKIILLSIVTCGIYSLVWYYKMGEWLQKVGQKYGKNLENEGTLLLLLGIFFAPAATYIIQDRINQIAS